MPIDLDKIAAIRATAIEKNGSEYEGDFNYWCRAEFDSTFDVDGWSPETAAYIAAVLNAWPEAEKELRAARGRVAGTNVNAAIDALIAAADTGPAVAGGHVVGVSHVANLEARRRDLLAAIDRDGRRVADLHALAASLLDSVKAQYNLFTPEFRAEERMMEPAEAAEQFARWQAVLDGKKGQ